MQKRNITTRYLPYLLREKKSFKTEKSFSLSGPLTGAKEAFGKKMENLILIILGLTIYVAYLEK